MFDCEILKSFLVIGDSSWWLFDHQTIQKVKPIAVADKTRFWQLQMKNWW